MKGANWTLVHTNYFKVKVEDPKKCTSHHFHDGTITVSITVNFNITLEMHILFDCCAHDIVDVLLIV